ncbi:hypothetical protein PG993_011780 [Apiospora rasikravindrae]|uniref:Uncharacterized protein n=1 Tax=Apiospora rasikravindrae TaxID=990691 RepID=A0ABR1S0K7_9PEZI
MERPTSRPPSLISAQGTSTAAASRESFNSNISSRISHDQQVSIGERNGPQDMQAPSLNAGDDDPGAHRPVATDYPATSFVEYSKRKIDWIKIVADCVSILLPVGFVVFVALVWSLKGSRVIGDSHNGWQNAITVMATALPIVFASVVGRVMSEATRWRLERGATVGSLEQLMGSRTVGGAVMTVFQFQSWNLLTAALLVIWALSPMGTQSLLRMSKLQPGIELGTTSITYFDNSARSQLVDWSEYEYSPTSEPRLTAKLRALASLYTTVVSTPETLKQDTMDLWGNVKVPFLESANDNNWSNTPQKLSADRYSSLVGVPLHHAGQDSKTTFSLESSYMQLQCSNTTTSNSSWPDGSSSDNLDYGMLERSYRNFVSQQHIGTYLLPNGTWHGFPMQRNKSETTWSLALDRFLDPLWFGANNTNYTEFQKYAKGPRTPDFYRPNLFKNEAGIEAGPTRLLLRARCSDSFYAPQLFLTGNCGVTQRYIESRVTCARSTNTSRICSVTAQRPSQQVHAPDTISPLSFSIVFYYMSKEMTMTIGGSISYQTEMSLHYLADPGLNSMNGGSHSFLENVTDKDLGARLSQLLNTYYQLSQLSTNVTVGANETSILGPSVSVDAESSKEVNIFAVSDGWAGLCLVTCVAMLAAGVLSVVFAHRARGPETLGYVSTVFRDSKHFELHPGSDRLPAVELSKSMAKERIRYGLVKNKKGEKVLMGVAREEETGRVGGM